MNDTKTTVPSGKILHMAAYDASQPELAASGDRQSLTTPVALAAALQQARAEFGDVALLVLRIREFQELAESFGDHCARQLGRETRVRLEGCLRDSDRVFALDGGEFAIVLPRPGELENLDHICARLVRVCGGPYRLDDVAPLVNAEIGIALYPADTGDVGDLMRFARIALRRADTGNNESYNYFSCEMLKRQRYKIWMEAELERALVAQRFVLHYQPQYSLDSHDIVGLEALVRLVKEDGDLIPPDDFIGIAEENGFIVPLGHWVIGEACRQLSAWRQAGCGPSRIAVNVSPQQLLDERLLDVIDQAIAENGLLHTDLELEITESCLLQHLPAAGDILQVFRDRGVRIAIDDFGAGYSSFAALAQLPLDIFKMDRTLLAHVDADPRARHVVTAMIAMARELGYQVIAEGVETAQQHQFLQINGCDLGQGFGLARPQDANAIGSLLQLAHRASRTG